MKKLIGIVLAISLVMVVVACGSAGDDVQTEPVPTLESETVEAPVPEVSEPKPTEAPMEEPEATEEVEETPEVTEEVAEEADSDIDIVKVATEDNPVVDGIDFSEYYTSNQPVGYAMNEQAKYDTLKVFVASDKDGIHILSDGDKFTQKDGCKYVYWYYGPKAPSSIEQTQKESDFYDATSTFGGKVLAYEELHSGLTGEDMPVGIQVKYEDGTEDSITIYVTKE